MDDINKLILSNTLHATYEINDFELESMKLDKLQKIDEIVKRMLVSGISRTLESKEIVIEKESKVGIYDKTTEFKTKLIILTEDELNTLIDLIKDKVRR